MRTQIVGGSIISCHVFPFTYHCRYLTFVAMINYYITRLLYGLTCVVCDKYIVITDLSEVSSTSVNESTFAHTHTIDDISWLSCTPLNNEPGDVVGPQPTNQQTCAMFVKQQSPSIPSTVLGRSRIEWQTSRLEYSGSVPPVRLTTRRRISVPAILHTPHSTLWLSIVLSLTLLFSFNGGLTRHQSAVNEIRMIVCMPGGIEGE